MASAEDNAQPGRKLLSTLKESMVKGKPFPRLHAKAAETKAMLQPMAAFLEEHKDDGRIAGGEQVENMIKLLGWSFAIDELVHSMNGFVVGQEQGQLLEGLVYNYNVTLTRPCQFFHAKGMFLFNFVPKNHYMFHLAQRGRHMSPKLAWCYQGEDLMNRVKILAKGSYHGIAPRKLGNKILAKYLVALDLTLSQQ